MKGKEHGFKRHLPATALTTAAGLAMGTQAYGAIQYTDIPDQQIGPNDTYNLDLNNDSVNDYTIGHQVYWTTTSYGQGEGPRMTTTPSTTYKGRGSLGVSGQGANSVVGSTSFAAPMNNGSNVFSTQSFTSGGYMAKLYTTASAPQSTGSWIGPWIGLGGARFLGFEFDISGQTHYGWARLSVNDDTGVATLFDYAYEDLQDTAISAGAVPEPGTLVGMAVGAAALLAARMRKRKKQD